MTSRVPKKKGLNHLLIDWVASIFPRVVPVTCTVFQHLPGSLFYFLSCQSSVMQSARLCIAVFILKIACKFYSTSYIFIRCSDSFSLRSFSLPSFSLPSSSFSLPSPTPPPPQEKRRGGNVYFSLFLSDTYSLYCFISCIFSAWLKTP